MAGVRDVASLVGADVAAVLESLGVRVSEVASITGLPDRTTGRATFRVALEDGRVLKVRRLTRAAKGARFARLLRNIASPSFPPVLALEGRVCIEDWVEGTPLSELPVGAEQLRYAADMLGGLHAAPSAGARAARGPRRTRPLLQGTARRLAQLGDAGALERREVEALLEAAVRCAPERAPTGVIHTDFCADNLVEDRAGRLVVVDNEGLRLDFLDYDVARTWYRWPMSEAEWSVFLTRYTRWRQPPPEPGAAPFWRIAALVKSLHLRTSRGTDQQDTPVRRLRAILAELDGPPRP